MRGKQAIFNLEIKKKSGLSINPDIHLSKVFSSGEGLFKNIYFLIFWTFFCKAKFFNYIAGFCIKKEFNAITCKINEKILMSKYLKKVWFVKIIKNFELIQTVFYSIMFS